MKILIIDASVMIYEQFEAVGHLSNSSGEATGLRFGVMRSIASYVKQLGLHKVIMAYDTAAPILKAQGATFYKASRESTPEKEKMYSQVPALKDMLALTYVDQVWADGYEADDLIGAYSRTLAPHLVYIKTTDNDATQLVNPRVQIYMPPKKGTKAWYKDEDWVRFKFGVEPVMVPYLRSVIGDESDEIPELGLAEDKVKSFLNSSVMTHDFHEKFEAWLPPDILDRFRLNFKLHSLPRTLPENRVVVKGTRDKVKFLELADRMESKTFRERVDEYTKSLI